MKKRIFFAAIVALVAWLLLSGAALAQRYVFQDLGDLGGGGSVALGLNDAGQVVGSSYTRGLCDPGVCVGPEDQGHAAPGRLGRR